MADRKVRERSETVDLEEGDIPFLPSTTNQVELTGAGLEEGDIPFVSAPQSDPGKVDVKPGFLGRAGEAIADTASSAVDFLSGSDRTEPRHADLPEVGFSGAGSDLPVKQSAGVGAVLATVPGENAQADIIKDIVPEAEFEKDQFGNVLVKFPGDSSFAFLNKPGISLQDFGTMISQILQFTPAGRLMRGAPLVARAPAVAAAAGATSVAQDVGAAAAGSEQGVDIAKALFATLGGAAGELAIPAMQGFVTKVLQSGRLDKAQVQKMMLDTGIDPRFINDDFVARVNDPAFRQEALAASRGSPTAASAQAGRALSEEFEVPLTQGQATQEATQVAREQGATGLARRELADFEEGRQIPAIEQATEDLTKQGAGGLPVTRLEASEKTLEAVQARAAGHRAEIGKAFKTVEELGDLKIKAVTMDSILKRFFKKDGNLNVVVDSETGEQIVIDELSTASMKAIKDIDRLIPKLSKPKDPPKRPIGFTADVPETVRRPRRTNRPSINLTQINQTRKFINQRFDQAANPTDRKALTIIKKEYDRWLDDAVDNSLFEGDATALQVLKEARKLRKLYGDLFEQRRPDDIAGRVVDKIITDPNMTNLEVANWMFGASRVGHSKTANRVVDRMQKIFEPDSPQMESIRQASVRNLFFNPKTEKSYVTKASPAAGYKKIVANLDDYLDGAGSEYAKKMHSPEQLAELGRFKDLMQRFIAPKSAVDLNSKITASMEKLGEVMGFKAGGFLGMQAVRASQRAVKEVRRGKIARRSINHHFATMKPPATVQIGPASGVAAASTPDPDG